VKRVPFGRDLALVDHVPPSFDAGERAARQRPCSGSFSRPYSNPRMTTSPELFSWRWAVPPRPSHGAESTKFSRAPLFFWLREWSARLNRVAHRRCGTCALLSLPCRVRRMDCAARTPNGFRPSSTDHAGRRRRFCAVSIGRQTHRYRYADSPCEHGSGCGRASDGPPGLESCLQFPPCDFLLTSTDHQRPHSLPRSP